MPMVCRTVVGDTMEAVAGTGVLGPQSTRRDLVHAAVERQGGVAVLDERPHELVARLLPPPSAPRPRRHPAARRRNIAARCVV